MCSSGFELDFRIPVPKRYYLLIPRAFNDVIETAVCYIYTRISVFNTFRSFEVNEMRNKGAFSLFVCHLENRYFPTGYNPQKFLYFCSQLVYMAVSFYKAGKTYIPKLAIAYILKAIKIYEVPEAEFWNGLNIAALGYIKIAFKCGFAKMSDFESMKIQFVINQSLKEQSGDDNGGIVQGSATNVAQKEYLLKLSSEMKNKLELFYDHTAFSENNLFMSEVDNLSKLYQETLNLELSSDYSSTNSKKNLEIGVDKKSIHKIKLDTDCADSPTKTSVFERQKEPPQKYRVFQVLSGFVNRSAVCACPEICECLFNTNLDYASKDMFFEVLRSLKGISDDSSIKSDTTKKSTSATYGQKVSPTIRGEKYGEFFFANESHKKSSNSALNEESSSITGKKSARLHIPEEFPNTEEREAEGCPLKTVNFDICDQFVMDIVMKSGTDKELYGEDA